ncbi:uL30 family ribosomal protein [Candidatus Pacearchaeota archaeon]|nr:uL30 family ribosomal protein [Candidatus Pacearchaeota archaeon]
MLAIIRIKGRVKVSYDAENTLSRLRLRRKYACVVIKPSKENLGMVKRVKDFVAYGEIKKETFEKLLEKRSRLIDRKKKTDFKNAASGIEAGKNYEEFNIKPFFRLHPPRDGIEIKKQFGVGKGVLGNNKENINKLIERML